MMTVPAIEPVRAADVQRVLALLEQNGLPTLGFDSCVESALVAREDDKLVGSVGLELYGSFALLRSLAVADSSRGRGLGAALTLAALELAGGRGVQGVYLLTETAGEFFPRFGFRAIDRAAVPAEVRESPEFTSACPESALAMVVELEGAGPHGRS